MERIRMFKSCGIMSLTISIMVLIIGTASATQVVLNVPAYPYNTIDASGNGYDGLTGAIGCGPTTGAMIMDYWTNHGAPNLITNPLADARLMGAGPGNTVHPNPPYPTYMDIKNNGDGPSHLFQFGFVKFAASRGYDFKAVIHVYTDANKPLSSYQSLSSWSMYTYSGSNQNILGDASFWNPATWQINPAAFIAFIKSEIDAGRPLSASVFQKGEGSVAPGTIVDTGLTPDKGGATHWMPIVGYNDVTNQWAGLNTWDNSVHWYTPTSAFYNMKPGDPHLWVPHMSIAYVRTFHFVGPIGGNIPPSPPSNLKVD